MTKTQNTKKVISKKRHQEEENLKVLANFFKESTAILHAARKEARQRYPDLFKAS